MQNQSIQVPQEVAIDIDNGFIITDIDDNFQRYKMVNESTFIYRIGQASENDLVEMAIDVDTLSEDEVEDALRPYYGSLVYLKEDMQDVQDTSELNMIIAECHFETNKQPPRQ